MAIPEERRNTPQEWAKKNINIRQGFTKKTKRFYL